MIGPFMNGTARQVRRATAAMPDAQQLAVKAIVERAAALSGTSSQQLVRMHVLSVRAAYAAADETEQLEHLMESAAITVALSRLLTN